METLEWWSPLAENTRLIHDVDGNNSGTVIAQIGPRRLIMTFKKNDVQVKLKGGPVLCSLTIELAKKALDPSLPNCEEADFRRSGERLLFHGGGGISVKLTPPLARALMRMIEKYDA